jgi:hypothetical protein
MKLNAQDLKEIATLTLEHYNQRAEEFSGRHTRSPCH